MRRPELALLFALAAAGTHAADPAVDAEVATGWNGSLDAGYTGSAGNTSTTTLLASTRASRTDGRLTHHLEARAKNTEENHSRTAEAYRLAGKEDRALGARDYLFVTLGWDKDRYSGYEWQLAAAVGYGRKLIDRPGHRLALEAGPGYHHDELPGNDTDDTGVLYAAADYALDINAGTRFIQLLSAEAGPDNTTTRALSELAVKMNSRLALKASVEFRRNSAPPAGSKNTDRTTSLALAWTF